MSHPTEPELLRELGHDQTDVDSEHANETPDAEPNLDEIRVHDHEVGRE